MCVIVLDDICLGNRGGGREADVLMGLSAFSAGDADFPPLEQLNNGTVFQLRCDFHRTQAMANKWEKNTQSFAEESH